MATFPTFSFSGWNSSSLAPRVNPATVPGAASSTAGMVSQAASAGGAGMGLATSGTLAGVRAKPTAAQIKAWAAAAGMTPGTVAGTPIAGTPAAMLAPGAPPGVVDTFSAPGTPGTPGTLVGTTNAANTNLPAWLQAEMDRLNAQDALRAAALGGGGGGGGGATAPPAFDPNLGVAAVTNARANYNTSLHAINEAARLQLLIQRRNQMPPVGGFGFNDPLQVPAQIGLDREIEAYRNVNLPVASGFRPSGWVQPTWR